MAWFKTPEEEIRKSNPFYERDQQRYDFKGFFRRPAEQPVQSRALTSYVAEFISQREQGLERKVKEEQKELQETWMPQPGYKGHLVVDAQVPVIGEVKPDPKQLSLFPNFYPERKIVHYEPRIITLPPKKEPSLSLP